MKRIFSTLKVSLSARLLVFFLLFCLCALLILAVSLARGFGSQWQYGIKPHLNQYLSYVNADIGNPPDLARAQALASELPINIYIEGPNTSFTSTGKALDQSELRLHQDRRRWGKRSDDLSDKDNTNLSFDELDDRTVLRNKLGEYSIYYEIEHGSPDVRRSGAMHFGLACLLALFALSYWLLRRMLKPVRDIQQGVIRMGQGELDYRVPVLSDNDLGELASSVNHMAGDIEGMLNAKRELLLAVSHELRSPLTRAKIAVQMLEESRNQASIAGDLSEMEQLISELLEAERLNSRHSALNKTNTDLLALLNAVQVDFPEGSIELEIPQDLPMLSLDETRIKLALRNLVNNAIIHSHNAKQGPVLTASVAENILRLSVQDFGDGIAAEHLQHITEPFYRTDASRTRGTGGFGLGLYLVQQICHAHHGELLIISEVGKGSTMSIELPV